MFYPVVENGSVQFAHLYLKNLVWMYYLTLAIVLLIMLAVYRLNTSRIGRAWMAVREDETAAELTGIHTTRMKLYAYMLEALFPGFAGAFFAAKVRSVNPSSFIFLESALVLCIVVLGGIGSIPGIIIGAAAIIVLAEMFRVLALYRMAAFGGAMTAMMVFRPEGLLPADKIAGLGITRVPEGRRILPRLSVEDNLEMGVFLVKDKRSSGEIAMKSWNRVVLPSRAP